MALSFVAIDFETANFTRASACSVGIVRVEDGEIRDSDQWFVDPPGGAYFTNTGIHGIAEEHVVGAPSWANSVDRIAGFAGGMPLVAYSGFDRGVYNAANSLIGLSDRGFDWRDAHTMARRSLSAPEHGLSDYRLPTVARYLGIPEFAHHDAVADARACADIVLKIAALHGHSDLQTLWPNRIFGTQARVYVPKGPLPEANLEADPEHPLFGQSICFTGKLDSFTQADAERIAADFGARIEDSVTRRTTLVVVGQFSPAHLRVGAKLSSKATKAAALAASGQAIDIVDEAAFLTLINLHPADY